MRTTIIYYTVIAALLGGCVTAYTDHGPKVRHVRNDEGGYVYVYQARALETEAVKFDGWCASACTMYLGVPEKCATSRARFAFHRAYDSGSVEEDDYGTRLLVANYPEWVRRWIDGRGGLTNELLVMPNSYIMQHMEQCK